MRSPIPASPAKVSGLAPAAIPSRIISARPRVSSPALPLSPKPRPSAAPAAIATTFLSAPASSTPRMSWFTYSRNRRRARRATIRSASARSVGRHDRRRRQVAGDLGGQVGPGQGGDPRPASIPAPSAMTSLIRSSVPRSRPLTTDRTSALGARYGAHAAAVVRRWADGAANRTRSVASASAAAIRRGEDGRRQVDARQAALVPARGVDRPRPSPPSGTRSVTGSTRAMTRASVVPHAPAPTTATRGPSISGSSPADRASGAGARRRPASRPPGFDGLAFDALAFGLLPFDMLALGRRPCRGCACGAAA